jgi:CO dehydrogenase/acetyl-CoA synthase beta subunit
MSLFDDHIEQIARYLVRMRATGRPVREMQAGGLLFKVGPSAGPGLVLKSETFMELGSPTVGSCALVLLTEEAALVRDGRITLVGPDMTECEPGVTLPFGQVIVAAGPGLTEAHYPALVETQYVADQIEGFMVKSTPGRVWGRVSMGVAVKGFDFAFLGAALRKLVMTHLPEATAVETVFVTSGKADLEPLGEIAAAAGVIARDLKKQRWEERGIDLDDCAFGGHCGSCPDKTVCDEVKKLAHTRKRLAAEAEA